MNQVAEVITESASEEANIIFGAIVDEKMKDEVEITIIATGFDHGEEEKEERVSEIADSFSFDDLDVPAFLRKK